MSLTQFRLSTRQPGAGLRSSLKTVAVGQPSSWADRVRRQFGLRPNGSGHGTRCTAGRMRSVPSPSAPSPALTLPVTNFGYQYDAAGNRTQKSTLDYTEDYGYDPLYRLTRADRTNPGAVPPNQWTWNYDAVGNRTSAQKDQEATTSTHNEKNQLLQTSGGGKMLWRGVLDEPGTATFNAASASINGQPARMLAGNVFEATLDLPAGANTVTIQAQDGSGNVSSKSYSVNVLGVPATYTYDANGNLATKTEGADAWVYTWNALNQLTAVSKNGVTVATYQYDPLRRRLGKNGPEVTTSWTYDGEDIVRQTTGTGVANFVHGYGIDEPLARESQPTGELTFLHADVLDSIVASSAANGSLAATVRYDAWGNLQAGAPSPYGFTGREWDADSRLWYYRARYYDSAAGRFLREDPIGFSGGVNFFSYVDNSPANFADPRGTDNPRCDWVPDELEGNCVLNACAAHDKCFHDNKCTAMSWLEPELSPSCSMCNVRVAASAAVCAVSPRPTMHGPECYDAKTARFVKCPPADPVIPKIKQVVRPRTPTLTPPAPQIMLKDPLGCFFLGKH